MWVIIIILRVFLMRSRLVSWLAHILWWCFSLVFVCFWKVSIGIASRKNFSKVRTLFLTRKKIWICIYTIFFAFLIRSKTSYNIRCSVVGQHFCLSRRKPGFESRHRKVSFFIFCMCISYFVWIVSVIRMFLQWKKIWQFKFFYRDIFLLLQEVKHLLTTSNVV